MDRILISIDGATKEEYESVRLGANFETLVQNVETLIRVRKKCQVTHPKIRIQTVRFPEADADAYLQRWEKYVVNIGRFRNLLK